MKVMFQQQLIHSQWPWALTAVVGGVLFLAWFVVYITRAILYPKRFAKDFDDKNTRYFVSAIPIAFLLFGFLSQRESHDDGLARALFWLGSTLNFALTLWLFSTCLSHPIASGSVSPAMVVPLLGNMLAGFTLSEWYNLCYSTR